MQKHLLTLVALLIGYLPFLSAQESIIPDVQKTKPFKTLPEEYIQHQQKLVTKNASEWWQPDSALYNCDGFGKNFLVTYLYNESGYITNISYRQSYSYENWDEYARTSFRYDEKDRLIDLHFEMYHTGQWVNLDREEYIYENDKLITINGLSQDDDGSWWVTSTLTFSYDMRGNLIKELKQRKISNIWINEYQFLYTYDERNNMLSDTEQSWGINSWINKNIHIYRYDEKDNKIVWQYETNYNGQWTITEFEEYEYNNNNYCIKILSKYWNSENNTLENDRRQTYVYDTNNNCINIKREGYNITPGIWENIQQDTFAYDSNNNLLSKLREVWHVDDWTNYTKEEFYYDDNNNDILHLQSKWFNDIWTYTNKYEYKYDERNNLLESTKLEYNSNNWENREKYIYEYDDNGNGIKGAFYKLDNELWYTEFSNLNVQYNNGKSILNGEHPCYYLEVSYTKTPKPAGIEEVEQSTSEITIYPNPAKDNINISVENDKIRNVQIYNLTGKLVKQEKSNKINISDLPVGMYIIKVETEAGNYIKKVIKD